MHYELSMFWCSLVGADRPPKQAMPVARQEDFGLCVLWSLSLSLQSVLCYGVAPHSYIFPVNHFSRPKPCKTSPQGTSIKRPAIYWDHAVSWGGGGWVSVSDIGRVGKKMVLRRIPIYFLSTIFHDLKPKLASPWCKKMALYV